MKTDILTLHKIENILSQMGNTSYYLDNNKLRCKKSSLDNSDVYYFKELIKITKLLDEHKISYLVIGDFCISLKLEAY